MRHGIAVEREDWDGPDAARPLTLEGRKKTKAIAKALKRHRGLSVDEIWASPLARARETAEIVGEVLDVPVRSCAPLGEGAGLDDLAPEIQAAASLERILMVGHEPDLGFLLAGLIGEREARPFKKGGVAFLSGTFAKGKMHLEWQLAPKEILGE